MAKQPPATEATAPETAKEAKGELTLFSLKGILILGVVALICVGGTFGMSLLAGVRTPKSGVGEVNREDVGEALKLEPVITKKFIPRGGGTREPRTVSITMSLEVGGGPGGSTADNLKFLKEKALHRVNSEVFRMLDDMSYDEVASKTFLDEFKRRVKARMNEVYGEDTVRNVWILGFSR
ncbi:MAG: flagellar basal body-associated FliL family protein [Planctomycetes bacterium]|nr:flagellar basal body-associated FliL family protein [Planctomycetota bacterium]